MAAWPLNNRTLPWHLDHERAAADFFGPNRASLVAGLGLFAQSRVSGRTMRPGVASLFAVADHAFFGAGRQPPY